MLKQINFKTSLSFTKCTYSRYNSVIFDYYNDIYLNEIFAENREEEYIVNKKVLSKDNSYLYVILESYLSISTHPYFLRKVYFENDYIIHNKIDSFEKIEEALDIIV